MGATCTAQEGCSDATPSVAFLSEESESNDAYDLTMRENGYNPEPIVTRSAVIVVGGFLFVLANIWAPLLLVVTYLASILIPYCFRWNDDVCNRRQLLEKFETEDEPTAHLREIPDDVRVESSYRPNSRGMLLYTAIYTPVNAPIKAVICFCHGYSDCPSFTKRQNFAYLVQHGIAVVVMESEGHGHSDGPLGLIPDWDVMIGDVCGFFDDVRRNRFPDKKFFLMGESMGGAVAFSVSKTHHFLFSGVVFLSPMCKIADNMLPPQWVIDLGFRLAGPSGTTTLMGYLPVSPSRGDLRLLTYKLAWKRALLSRVPSGLNRRPRLATARELLRITQRISNSLREFDVPFLIQHGKDDKVTDPKLSQALYDESKSEDKTIRLYEGMWHSLLGGEPTENAHKVLDDTIEWIISRSGDNQKKTK